ncbi:unnamed protein product [Phytophthora lilii]|uniref:RxLR effector protein n=1 Tax=Phytophthora lilii TaxID=2077276 RepID=A0A9W6TUH4_9STRA|nr:unnamed protein product [Phytophthora lilii]
MRLSSIVLLSAATLVASCAASAPTQSEINSYAQRITSESLGIKSISAKRSLRTVDDDEERGGKVLPEEVLNKIQGVFNGETLPGKLVKKLLPDDVFRREKFEERRRNECRC